MAKQTLPTNYKDDILSSAMDSKRRYKVINNSDGTISLVDATVYDQVGSNFGAAQLNEIGTAVNESVDKANIIDDANTIATNTASGKVAGALAVKSIKNSIPAATKVKGNAETSYRTGEVNLTPANIGSVAKNGDTMTGNLAFSGQTASRAAIFNSSKQIVASTTTDTELGYLHGVTSSVQNQINAKQSSVTGAATTITGNDLATNRALISNGNGKVAVSAVTSTELGYLDGVTSNIQTQFNNINKNLGGVSFGITADGQPGYKKAGADTVYPFSSDLPSVVISGGIARGQYDPKYQSSVPFVIAPDGYFISSVETVFGGSGATGYYLSKDSNVNNAIPNQNTWYALTTTTILGTKAENTNEDYVVAACFLKEIVSGTQLTTNGSSGTFKVTFKRKKS